MIEETKNFTVTPKDEPSEQQLARMCADVTASPFTNSALTLEHLSALDTNWIDLSHALQQLTKPLQEGDTSNVENTMLGQIAVLDAIFGRLCRIAFTDTGSKPFRPEYIDLAMRVQKNCRNTMETLKSFKSKSVIIGQQNIAENIQINQNL